MPLPPRSWLLIPGDQPGRIQDGLQSGADALILDLEDSVAPDSKPGARETVRAVLERAVLERADPAGPRLWVRINPLESEHWHADLDSVLTGSLAGIVLPKALPSQIGSFAAELDSREAKAGLAPGSVGILPIVTETAPAVLSLDGYRAGVGRMTAMTWGAEDLALDVGAFSSRDGDGRFTPLFELARSLTLLAAASTGAAPIETAFTDFQNEAGLADYVARGRRDGFVGMIAIHPAQVPVINSAFVPSDAEVARARAVVEAFEGSAAAGAAALGGKMLYAPHLAQAKRILEWSNSVGA